MYNGYFKFSCLPFENTLDQRFVFMSECHEEVIAALLYFVREKKSFALVCGDVGTGKTTIVHHLLSRLPKSVLPIVIPYPGVKYLKILRYIARVLRISTKGKDVLELSDDVKAGLIKVSAEGKRVVLIIDEAHLLPVSSLENIRLLSNIELTGSKLIQILLIGQNELALKLRKPELYQFRQRININRVLSSMNPKETIRYIDHRLRIAGSSFDACFEPACRKLICRLTGGVPRVINRLCDTALLICMRHKAEKVTRKILRKAHNALDTDSIAAQKSPAEVLTAGLKKLKPAVTTAAALFALIALGFLGYRWEFGSSLKPSAVETASKIELHAVVEKLVPVHETMKENKPVSKPEAKVAPAALTPSGKAVAPVAIPAVPAASPVKVQALGEKTSGVKVSSDADKNGAAKKSVPPAERQQEAKPVAGSADFIAVTVKKGDSLFRIAAKWFPENPNEGLKAIVAANPQIQDENRIRADKTLKVPRGKMMSTP